MSKKREKPTLDEKFEILGLALILIARALEEIKMDEELKDHIRQMAVNIGLDICNMEPHTK